MQIAKLTECEEIVMKAVWDCQKKPALSEILDIVTKVYKKDWKAQTVSTFLRKLVNKKFIRLERNGKMYTYKILIPESAYKRKLYRQHISLWHNNDIVAFCLEMIQNGDLTQEHLMI